MSISPNSFSITAIRWPCRSAQDVVEQRRLARAEKAGEDRDRDRPFGAHDLLAPAYRSCSASRSASSTCSGVIG